MLMDIARVWIYLAIAGLFLIMLTKEGIQHLKEYAMLLYTCNLLSGIFVIFIAYLYLPFTIVESIIKIIKENPMR